MDPRDPVPPRPPSPPRPEWLKAPAPAAPSAPGVTPMMDFFQRRVEALERELSLERERAAAAQSLLSQQEALKSEVDSQLKAISEQFRREKNEREGEESRSRAHGRVEALEKRLDEMNATFAQLLRDAVAKDGGPSSAALAAELSAFRAALKDGMDGVARWRGELRDLASLVPQVQSLAERLPQDEKLFEESVGRRLDDFAGRIARELADWRRGQDSGRAELDARLEAMARERADLSRAWESQARSLREEQFKDRVAREAELSRQIAELTARVAELAGGADGAARGHDAVREGLDQVLNILTATPATKDLIVAELEAEKAELTKAFRDRQEALRKFAEERRAVEKSMGDALVKLTGELESERARTRAAEARLSERAGEAQTAAARAADLERAVADRDGRVLAMAAERDELMRALIAESEKVRRALEDRRLADEAAERRLEELRRRVEEESARRAAAEGAAVDSRSQMAALAEQTARTLQERDATMARFAEWDKERQRLTEALRKKDEMITLLSATFQGAIKKGA